MAQFAAKHLPDAAMTLREASRHLVRNNVDYLPLAELDGRIATTLGSSIRRASRPSFRAKG